MDWGYIILSILLVATTCSNFILLYLLRKMDIERVRMEEYVITIGQVMSEFYSKINEIFSQSIHYYDETIYQFVQDVKDVKEEIDGVLADYDDLKEFIVPVPTAEERVEQEQKEVLGIVKKGYPISRV